MVIRGLKQCTRKQLPKPPRLVADELRAIAADPQKCPALGREIRPGVEAIKARLRARLATKHQVKIPANAERSPDPLSMSVILEDVAAKLLAEAGL